MKHSYIYNSDKTMETATNESIYREFETRLAAAQNNEELNSILLDFWVTFRGVNDEYIGTTVFRLLQDALEAGNHSTLGLCYCILGWLRLDYDKCDEALDYFAKAQRECALTNDKRGRIRALNGEASTYRQLGLYSKAFSQYLEALELAEELNEGTILSGITSNVGALLNNLKQYDEALKYFQTTLSLQQTSQSNLAITYLNVGLAYSGTGNHAAAEENYRESLRLAQELNSNSIIPFCYSGIGLSKYKTGDYDQASYYFQKA